MSKHISGIQQMGIGVTNAREAWQWYIKHFGMDVRVFEDAAHAALMKRYTGGEGHDRFAILALNMQGGGGFEIWEYTSRKSQPRLAPFQLGDLGINICRINSANPAAAHAHLSNLNAPALSPLLNAPDGNPHCYVKDPYGNYFEVVKERSHFQNTPDSTGGVAGAVMGVSDMDKSLAWYKNVLGYDQVIYDKTDAFEDFASLPGGDGRFRRVLLTHSIERSGPFSKLLGRTCIELVQALDRTPVNIYENRFWGDQGYIHLCFDVTNMNELRKECEAANSPFTVDSANSFDMGEAAGHFTYTEDPDGALIEFVETHRVPVLKKIGWYFNLKGRGAKPLPNWMVKSLGFNRVKR